MVMRAALFVMLGGFGAPNVAVAQTNAELDTLKDIISNCSNPAIMPGDWPDLLAPEWTQLTPVVESTIDAYLVWSTVATFAQDGDINAPLSPLAQAQFLAEVQSDFEWDKQVAAEQPEEWQESFYEHPTGWKLALDVSADYPADTYCYVWHMTPDTTSVEFLEQPYLSFSATNISLGTYQSAELHLPDTSGIAHLSLGIMSVDPQAYVQQFIFAEHPIRFLPPLSLELYYSAYSRDM